MRKFQVNKKNNEATSTLMPFALSVQKYSPFLLSTVSNLLLAGIDQYPVDAQPVLKVHVVSVSACTYKWVNLQQISWNFQVKLLKNCPLQVLGVIRSKSNLAADDIITNSMVWGFFAHFYPKKVLLRELVPGTLCSPLSFLTQRVLKNWSRVQFLKLR